MFNWFLGGSGFEPGAVDHGSLRTLRMGEHAHIVSMHYLDCGGGLIMDDHSWITGIRSTVLTHAFDPVNGGLILEPVTLEKAAAISTNCTVLPGVTLGEGALLAAGLDGVDPAAGRRRPPARRRARSAAHRRSPSRRPFTTDTAIRDNQSTGLARSDSVPPFATKAEEMTDVQSSILAMIQSLLERTDKGDIAVTMDTADPRRRPRPRLARDRGAVRDPRGRVRHRPVRRRADAGDGRRDRRVLHRGRRGRSVRARMTSSADRRHHRRQPGPGRRHRAVVPRLR